MKARIFAVMIAIAIICTGKANAQYYNYGSGLEDVDLSVSLAAGATLVNDFTSPVADVRLGAELNRFLGEMEFSYISINAVNGQCGENIEKNTLSTVTFGVNLGVKFLHGRAGYVALMMHGGYSMQEEWLFNEYHCHHGPRGHHYRGKGYFGLGLNGTVRIAPRFGLFAEARYQSMPVNGGGHSKWGGIFQGGIRFYF